MLDALLGSRTAQKIFLYIFHYGEAYATAIASDFKMSVGQVQRQLDRFENAGFLISKQLGRTRVYQFNEKSPLVRPFKEMIQIVYSNIPLAEREEIFHARRRPRRRGKPVIGRGER